MCTKKAFETALSNTAHSQCLSLAEWNTANNECCGGLRTMATLRHVHTSTSLHIHILYTHYTYYTHNTCIVHTVHVLYTQYMYYTHNTCIVHTVHVLYTHSTCIIHTIHVLYTHNTCTIRTVYTCMYLHVQTVHRVHTCAQTSCICFWALKFGVSIKIKHSVSGPSSATIPPVSSSSLDCWIQTVNWKSLHF